MVKENSGAAEENIAVYQTVADLRAFVAARRAAGRRVALVPTMGALHDGHMALVARGRAVADDVIVTIFVNPAQFGPNEDFSAYPRTWDSDLALCTANGAAAVFYPAVEEIYPAGFATTISVTGVTGPLEGAARPDHFNGVATVVAKLLLMALPDVALFGEKDWQQLQLIRRMTADLNIPVVIEGVPTLRDENGLALSSRNAYLSAAEYQSACALNKIMRGMIAALRGGGDVAAIEAQGARDVIAAGFVSVDYLTVRDAATLEEPTSGPRRILAAARIGRARLIDNMAVDEE